MSFRRPKGERISVTPKTCSRFFVALAPLNDKSYESMIIGVVHATNRSQS